MKVRESQAQAVAELLLAAFREGQKLSLVTTGTSTDLAQQQAALDAWDVAVVAYNDWASRYPDPTSAKSRHLARFLVYGNGLSRMTEALKLGFVTLKLLPRSQTHEQRDILYQAMEVAVNVFTVNKDYVFDGPAITSAQIV